MRYELLDNREGELTELAGFCTEPGQGPYVRWQAPPWAGKSALMSWFVLNPSPPSRASAPPRSPR
jgi:hypothetical protein